MAKLQMDNRFKGSQGHGEGLEMGGCEYKEVAGGRSLVVQIMYLIKDLSLEYIKYSQLSTKTIF